MYLVESSQIDYTLQISNNKNILEFLITLSLEKGGDIFWGFWYFPIMNKLLFLNYDFEAEENASITEHHNA